jgi:PAS domain S-box-containing protein
VSAKGIQSEKQLKLEIKRLQAELDEAKRALRASRSEGLLEEQIIKSAHEGVWVIDLDGTTTFVNDRMAEMLGYSPAEMLGRDAFEFVWPEDVPSGRTEWEKRCTETKGMQSVYRYSHKDGRAVWCLVDSSPMLDRRGKKTAILGLFSDITERKLAEEKIRSQRAIFEAINAILQETLSGRSEEDLGRLCLRVSEEITESKFGFIGEIGSDGRLHDIAISETGWELCTLDDQTGHGRPPGRFKIHGLYGRVLKDGKSLITNDPLRHPERIGYPEGHPRLTAFLGVPLKRRGRTIGLIAVGNRPGGYREEDREALEALSSVIVESLLRGRAEDAAEDSEERARRKRQELEAIYDSAPVGLCVLDTELRFLRINERMAEISGLPAEKHLGRSIKDILPGIADQTSAVLKRVVETGKPVLNVEISVEIPAKKGVRRAWTQQWLPLKSAEGEVVAANVVIRDVTEDKRAEAELRKEKARFELLSETASQLLSLGQRREIIADLCRRVADFLDCDIFFLYLCDEDTGRSSLEACRGISDASAETVVQLEHGWADCGRPAQDSIRVISETAADSGDPGAKLIRSFGAKSLACLQLVSGERVFGTLAFGSGSRAVFIDEELQLMRSVADQVAIALERRMLFGSLEASRNRLEAKVRQRTAELAQANELLERMFSSIDLSIAYLDRDMNFIRVNRAYAAADGKDPDFFVGKNHFVLYPNPENEKIFRRVVRTGKPYSVYAKPFQYPDDPERGVTYWDWSLQPIKSLDGRVEGIILSLVDVTERIKAEESARRDEALLRTVFESLPLGVWLADKNGRITHANPAGQKIWMGARYVGIEQFDAYKGWWADTGKKIEPEDWAIARAIRKGETSLNEEIEIECFDGSRKLILNSAIPIRDDRGRIIGAFIINEDITERKKAEKNLRQMQKMEALGTLAGGIAHDFNNILMPITINAELALCDASEGSPLYDYLRQILEASERGKELVKQIITFSRQREQERKTIRIGPVLEEAVDFLKTALPKNIEIRSRIEAESDIVRADPTQVHQVVMNLGNNAAQAMKHKGGRLEIFLSDFEMDTELIAKYPGLKAGKYIRLGMSDSGCGMSNDLIERIFDPFFTTKPPGEGTGMGLAVVHGIVKNHDGAISVYSEPGKGSTFNIYLPKAEGEPDTVSRKAVPVRGGNESILLVDDEPAQLRTVRHMLERLGYRVQAQADSEEAAGVFRASPDAFDLVITDQTMTGMTGEELAESILAVRPKIPIILTTGFSELIDAERAREKGIRGFLMKPFSVKDIAQLIRNVLERDEDAPSRETCRKKPGEE